MNPFIGQILIFAGNFAPRGWAYCDGQLLGIAQHTALFSIIGTTYGGDGRTTFALPDLRGRIPLHNGNSTGPGLSSYRLGERGGTQTVVLNFLQIPSHHHSLVGTAKIQVGVEGKGVALEDNPFNHFLGSITDAYRDTGSGATMNANAIGGTTLPTGGTQAHDNMQPYLVLHYIIAMVGRFPSRN